MKIVRSGLKVLIIDDETEICYLLTKILKGKGVECYSVYSLSEAKSFLNTFSPSVIFLDNHLPDGLGIDFLGYLKLNYPEIKVVLITAHDTLYINGKNVEPEDIEIIYKPFNSNRILVALEQATRN